MSGTSISKEDDEFLLETREGGQLEEYYHSCGCRKKVGLSNISDDIHDRELGARQGRGGKRGRIAELHEEHDGQGKRRESLAWNLTSRLIVNS
jgi:hypothetical protein